MLLLLLLLWYHMPRWHELLLLLLLLCTGAAQQQHLHALICAPANGSSRCMEQHARLDAAPDTRCALFSNNPPQHRKLKGQKEDGQKTHMQSG